jgi:hypothetical protein
MKTKSVLSLAGVIGLILGACNMPGTPPIVQPTALSNSEVAIDMYYPSNGSIYSVGGLIYLNGVIKLASDTTPINEASFLINGSSLAATINDAVNPKISNGTWTPSDPGEYYIQARVTLGDGSIAISEPHRVCVMPVGVEPSSDWGGGRGYLGPCPLATRIASPASTGDLTFNVVAAPSTIRATVICTDVNQPLTPSITFIAQLDDPQDLVALVHVSIRNPAGGSILWESYLNWVTTRPVNQKEYRGTLQNPSDVLSSVDAANWQAIAYGRDGHQIQMVEGVITVQLIDCNQYPQPQPGIAPPTPASDRDCPPGTYYASNRCIQIQIQPSGGQPGSPSNPQPSCPAGETYTCDPVCGCAPG